MMLSFLSDEDKYGYEMVLELSHRPNNTFELMEGTLHPLLRALEKSGVIYSYLRTSPRGRSRRYYALTELGKGCLQEKAKEWRICSESGNGVLRVASAAEV